MILTRFILITFIISFTLAVVSKVFYKRCTDTRELGVTSKTSMTGDCDFFKTLVEF